MEISLLSVELFGLKVPHPRRFRMAEDAVPPTLIFIVLGVLALLTPAQNDTFWHLRSGQYMWETKSLLTSESFSHTSYGRVVGDQWWLSQLVFYAAYQVGGAFLLTVLAGGCALGASWLSYRLVRGPLEIRVATLGFLAFATVAEWAVRPQVISLLFIAIGAYLIERDRISWLPALCVVWANVHAMVVLGVALSVACVLEAAIWSRRFLARDVLVGLGCVIAPMLSPLGLHYWPYLLATVGTSRELRLQEYRLSLDAASIPFWCAVALLILLAARRWRTLREHPRQDRILLVSAAILAVAAATAVRNVAFFAVIATPVLARLWARNPRPERVRPAGPGGYILVTLAALAAAAVVAVKWQNVASLGWEPLSDRTITAIRACPDPMFNHFEDGGYLMWALPGKRVFVDSRVDSYPLEFLQRSRTADLFGEYRSLFRDYSIACAVVRTGSPLDANLRKDDMRVTYGDSSRTVFVIPSGILR